ncbi:hypothetical protein L1987_22631 [Smallanthus sonchifolius]|uniref:Uncharacterized protein n=1 Tax=Smallanthus sonchifolius TaxID=185202 RepID=A0ACB9IFY1_9ASTR|nr:hypothetical protein L1987_22631 [Smallanthus sonchifolius]
MVRVPHNYLGRSVKTDQHGHAQRDAYTDQKSIVPSNTATCRVLVTNTTCALEGHIHPIISITLGFPDEHGRVDPLHSHVSVFENFLSVTISPTDHGENFHWRINSLPFINDQWHSFHRGIN